MRLGRERFDASLRRATRLDLDTVVRDLKRDEAERRATPRQIDRRRSQLLSHYGDPLTANRQLERILKGNDLTDVTYLMRGLMVARSVCRVVIRQQGRVSAYGTGFLVAPGVVMTNEHVLSRPAEVASSVIDLDYERDVDGNERRPARFALASQPEPIIERSLDFTLAAVSPIADSGQRLADYGWLKLDGQPGKAFIGEYLTIVQHPGGEPKQICVRENKLLRYEENSPYLWYQTDTIGGSSGSPVFNNDWEVVGLHHSSVPRTKLHKGKQTWFAINGEPWTSDMGDDRIDWLANEGIRISRIIAYLRQERSSHPLARAVLDAEEAPRLRAGNLEGGWDGRISTRWDGDGIVRVRVPVELGVRVGVGGLGDEANGLAPANGHGAHTLTNGAAANAVYRGFDGAPAATVVEKVVIDQTSYPKRLGYRPTFLGKAMAVPLPVPSKARGAYPIGKLIELKYWTYSVLFRTARKLAAVSAANVDPGKWRGNRDAEGDTWYNDGRIPADNQIGRSFYKKQSTFEADRSKNPFDQGHLTRRRDVQWGDDDQLAKRHGDDSYHYTNCAPQHWAFNQNNKAHGIWFRLEEQAAQASNGEPFSVFNGPIFDAPRSSEGADGVLRLAPRGKRIKDGTFGGVQIPKQYFKVFVYRGGRKLRHAAFVVTQEDLLATIDRYYASERRGSMLSDFEVRLYQVPLSTVERLTGLDFGDLGVAAATAADGREAALLDDGAPIEEPSQLRF
jgi:endonuclease G, mitochondrial